METIGLVFFPSAKRCQNPFFFCIEFCLVPNVNFFRFVNPQRETSNNKQTSKKEEQEKKEAHSLSILYGRGLVCIELVDIKFEV